MLLHIGMSVLDSYLCLLHSLLIVILYKQIVTSLILLYNMYVSRKMLPMLMSVANAKCVFYYFTARGDDQLQQAAC